jgi:hypothetical protein
MGDNTMRIMAYSIAQYSARWRGSIQLPLTKGKKIFK